MSNSNGSCLNVISENLCSFLLAGKCTISSIKTLWPAKNRIFFPSRATKTAQRCSIRVGCYSLSAAVNMNFLLYDTCFKCTEFLCFSHRAFFIRCRCTSVLVSGCFFFLSVAEWNGDGSRTGKLRWADIMHWCRPSWHYGTTTPSVFCQIYRNRLKCKLLLFLFNCVKYSEWFLSRFTLVI